MEILFYNNDQELESLQKTYSRNVILIEFGKFIIFESLQEYDNYIIENGTPSPINESEIEILLIVDNPNLKNITIFYKKDGIEQIPTSVAYDITWEDDWVIDELRKL